MCRRALLRLLCCAAIATFAVGQNKVVTLTNGSQVEGQVTRTNGQYEVRLPSGIVTVFPADQVVSIEDAERPEDEFEKRKAEIDPKSPDDHYRLAQWAFDREMYTAAREELKTALALKPDYERAQLLLRQVEARLQAQTQPSAVTRPTGQGPAGLGPDMRASWLVDQEDIYRIRRAELRGDDRVVIKYRNDVIERFIRRMEGYAEFEQENFSDTFRGYSDLRQTRYILRELDNPQASLARDILIETDPQFMVDFRSRIWPMVARHCASANCHGGNRVVGNLRLFNIAGRNERIDYTNFALLDGYVTGGVRMIDRDRPEESLLLQYTLPEDQAQHKHPTKLTPVFPSRRSAAYQRVEEWINELNGPPHPRYDLDYKPPFGMSLRFRTLPSVLRQLREPETQPSD
jgi:hypothetical protein